MDQWFVIEGEYPTLLGRYKHCTGVQEWTAGLINFCYFFSHVVVDLLLSKGPSRNLYPIAKTLLKSMEYYNGECI